MEVLTGLLHVTFSDQHRWKWNWPFQSRRMKIFPQIDSLDWTNTWFTHTVHFTKGPANISHFLRPTPLKVKVESRHVKRAVLATQIPARPTRKILWLGTAHQPGPRWTVLCLHACCAYCTSFFSFFLLIFSNAHSFTSSKKKKAKTKMKSEDSRKKNGWA